MKYAFVFLFALTCLSVHGQSPKKVWPSSVHRVQLFDSLYIDQAEVTNMDYVAFLGDIQRDSGSVYYKKMLPDTSVWDTFDPSGLSKTFYLRNPVLAYHPVVGVSYEQATAFCQWKSRVTSSEEALYSFRLPTEEEWVYAASANLDTAIYSFGFKIFEIRSTLFDNSKFYYDGIKNKQDLSLSSFDYMYNRFRRYGREPFFNCLKNFFNYFDYGARQPLSTIDQGNKKNYKASLLIKTAYNTNSKANDFGISGMIGNVAEMTSINRIAKGGSWAHYVENCKISKQLHYSGPAAWLGFRCVSIVTVLH